MGFAKVYTWTRLKSWQKLFQRFESVGIERLDHPPVWDEESEDSTKGNSTQVPPMNSKVWFNRRKEG